MLHNEATEASTTESTQKPRVVKVAAQSRSTAVAGAIAHTMRQYSYAEVQAIGPNAVNQALKAVAIARNYLEGDGIAIMFTPQFIHVEIEGEERTAMKFIVEPRF